MARTVKTLKEREEFRESTFGRLNGKRGLKVGGVTTSKKESIKHSFKVFDKPNRRVYLVCSNETEEKPFDYWKQTFPVYIINLRK